MLGKPRAGHFATKKDFDHLKTTHPRECAAQLRQLMDGVHAWLQTGVLAPGQDGIEDATHMVSTAGGGMPGEVETRVQLEWKVDPNAMFFKMGWTMATAKKFLKEVEK